MELLRGKEAKGMEESAIHGIINCTLKKLDRINVYLAFFFKRQTNGRNLGKRV